VRTQRERGGRAKRAERSRAPRSRFFSRQTTQDAALFHAAQRTGGRATKRPPSLRSRSGTSRRSRSGTSRRSRAQARQQPPPLARSPRSPPRNGARRTAQA
jgi:hypothetical protein